VSSHWIDTMKRLAIGCLCGAGNEVQTLKVRHQSASNLRAVLDWSRMRLGMEFSMQATSESLASRWRKHCSILTC
jgi:hypothetical protein